MDKTHDLGWAVCMAELMNALEVLPGLLRTALVVSGVNRRDFPAGWVTADEVIVTHRFLVIESGAMDYAVEGRVRRLEAGTQFFVPAWSRREWRVPRGGAGCRLSWCEFSSGEVLVPPALWWRRLPAVGAELRSLQRMRACFAQGGRAGELALEAELKAALARFWLGVEAVGSVVEGEGEARHPEVVRALVWLGRHYAEPDALEAFYRTVELSPNHFRLLFRRQTGETVQAVLARLRLRRARYLVRETSLPMKRIAGEAGFSDALYFSNQYKKFWGRPASADRAGAGLA